jgi:hypothetical protein
MLCNPCAKRKGGDRSRLLYGNCDCLFGHVPPAGGRATRAPGHDTTVSRSAGPPKPPGVPALRARIPHATSPNCNSDRVGPASMQGRLLPHGASRGPSPPWGRRAARSSRPAAPRCPLPKWERAKREHLRAFLPPLPRSGGGAGGGGTPPPRRSRPVGQGLLSNLPRNGGGGEPQRAGGGLPRHPPGYTKHESPSRPPAGGASALARDPPPAACVPPRPRAPAPRPAAAGAAPAAA